MSHNSTAKNFDLLAEACEAIEFLNDFKPVYLDLLKKMPKDQALETMEKIAKIVRKKNASEL